MRDEPRAGRDRGAARRPARSTRRARCCRASTRPRLLVGMAMERALCSRSGRRSRRGSAPHAARRWIASPPSRLDAFANRPDDAAARRDAARAFLLLGRYATMRDELAAPVQDRATDERGRRRDRALRCAGAGGARASATRRSRGCAVRHARPRQAPVAASGLVSLAELLDESGPRRRGAGGGARGARARRARRSARGASAGCKRTEVCALAALGRRRGQARRRRAHADGARTIRRRRSRRCCASAAATRRRRWRSRRWRPPRARARSPTSSSPSGALWAPVPSRLRALWTAFRRRGPT